MLQKVEKISQFCMLVPGLNPGPFTLAGTNSYLIGQSSKRLLLDTSQDSPAYANLLKGILKYLDCQLQKIVITHSHFDHVQALKSIFVPEMMVFKGVCADSDSTTQKQCGFKYLYHSQKISVDDFHLELIQTPGHCPDHCSYWDQKHKYLFTGDCVLGKGSCTITDLVAYLISLERLLEKQAEVLLPGHGPAIFGKSEVRERILSVIENRRERQRQILKALNQSCKSQQQMVVSVYGCVSESLKGGCMSNLRAHLTKLRAEGNQLALKFRQLQ